MPVAYRKSVGGVAKRTLVCAVTAAGFAGTLLAGTILAGTIVAGPAAAADLPALEIPGMKYIPDNLTWNGITVYGTVDVGYAYQSNGRPLGGVVSGLEYIPFTTSRNYTGQSVSSITQSGLEQSNIGLKIDEQFAPGWSVIGNINTGFDPVRGTLSDGCNSFVQNAGLAPNRQNSNADSGRCGQAFNNVAYGGVHNETFGTLTIGRNSSFQLDAIRAYDPMELSYAFSLLGYSGTDGGSGSTQAARWDNSVKYVFEYGPVHAGAMYSSGGSGTGMFGPGYAFNVGGNYAGFSIDADYTIEHGVVNLQTAINDTINGLPGGNNRANISDNHTWNIVGKYTWDFTSHTKGAPAGGKLTGYLGYTHIDQSNPTDPVLDGDAAGGYALDVIDNNAFSTDKVMQIFWAGAKYELPSGWTFTGAYYHVSQNTYSADIGGVIGPIASTVTNVAKPNTCVNGGASSLVCAGSFDQVSGLVDYRFNKHFDVYAGVTWARVDNGLAAAFPGTPAGPAGFAGNATNVSTYDFVTGLRLKF